MCRLLLASEFLATRDSPPPQLASHWALLAFGHEVVEVRMLPADPTRVKVCIWSVAPGPLAMFLATLAAQAATVARVAARVAAEQAFETALKAEDVAASKVDEAMQAIVIEAAAAGKLAAPSGVPR